jgi:DNA excision repair protein ERCC-1
MNNKVDATKANTAISTPQGNTILVSERQRGNPMLRYIRNAPWEYSREIIPDYVMGFTCAIFLSIKYHRMNPKHADLRIREVGKNFRLRVLLVFCDVDDDESVKPLHELNKLCFNRNFTLLLCWSNEECARYLETLKNYENRSSSSIQEKVETEFIPMLSKVLTTVRSINKTDVVTLLDHFGSLSGNFFFSFTCPYTENIKYTCKYICIEKNLYM